MADCQRTCPISTGVHQGDVLAPVLFNLLMPPCIAILSQVSRWCKTSVILVGSRKMRHEVVKNPEYADDMFLISDSVDCLKSYCGPSTWLAQKWACQSMLGWQRSWLCVRPALRQVYSPDLFSWAQTAVLWRPWMHCGPGLHPGLGCQHEDKQSVACTKSSGASATSRHSAKCRFSSLW